MAKEREYTVKLTAKELWEAINLIDAGFQSGPGNEVATSAANKLHEVWNKVPGHGRR